LITFFKRVSPKTTGSEGEIPWVPDRG